MSTIVLRNTKGSPLTFTEVDNNFNNLNTDKYQSGDSPSFAAVSVTGSSVPTNGIFLPAVTTVGISTNNTLKWKVDANGTMSIISTSGQKAIDISDGTVGIRIFTAGYGLFGTTTNHNVYLQTNNTDRITLTAAGVVQYKVNATDYEIGLRDIPAVDFNGTLTTSHRGMMVCTTTGITVPNATFSRNDVVSVYNNSASSQTITQGASLTLRKRGTATTGNLTLAARGMATIWFNSASEAICGGDVT